jgi:hypothetical protein
MNRRNVRFIIALKLPMITGWLRARRQVVAGSADRQLRAIDEVSSAREGFAL